MKAITCIVILSFVLMVSYAVRAATWTEYRITTSLANQMQPDIDGNIVVWSDYRHTSTDVYAANISDPNNPLEFSIANSSNSEGSGKVGGRYVFYTQTEYTCADGYNKKNLYMYNLDTAKTVNITNLGCRGQNNALSTGGIDGSTMVYGLTGYEIESDSIFSIPVHSSYVNTSSDVFGDVVVFVGYYQNGTRELFGFDLTTWQEFPICSATSSPSSAAIYGNIVVWVDYRNGNPDIYAADITDTSNPIVFPICENTNTQNSPAISGNIIVWEDNRNGNGDIYGYDISTQTEFQITDNPSDQSGPEISGHTVVWADNRHGQYDIYATILYGPQVPKCLSQPQGDLNNDCKVDLNDFALLVNNWLDCNLDPPEACWE